MKPITVAVNPADRAIQAYRAKWAREQLALRVLYAVFSIMNAMLAWGWLNKILAS